MPKVVSEYWIGETRNALYDNNLFVVDAIGTATDEMAVEARDKANALLSSATGKCRILVDINRAGKQSPKSRRIMQEFCHHPNVSKIAVFGFHPVARVVASFIMGMTGNETIRFFKTEDQARAWLGV